MRRSSPLDALLAPTVQSLLAMTLLQPERSWYLGELARSSGRPASSLQRPLRSLVGAGVLRRRSDGNRTYYQADPSCPYLPDLIGLIAKTSGLVEILRAGLEPLRDRLQVVFVFGSIAKSRERSGSDIDLFTVGTATLLDLAEPVHEMETTLGREIQVVTRTSAELRKDCVTRNHFIRSTLAEEKLFVIGNERDLERIVGATAG